MTWIRATSWWTLLVWLVVGWPAHGAGPAPERELTAAQYVTQSDLIFVGRLIEQESSLSEDRRLILTRHLFSIVEPVKGTPRDREALVEYGGVVDGLRLTVSHGATYELGREYLVFAAAGHDGELRTFGGQLGRLPVLADAAGERHVRFNPEHPLWSSLGERRTLRTIRELRSAIEAIEGGAAR